ncbi:uncharacterized protein [Nicotiana tomentosiformis]|uniref:uncharacterized protein n=1 Tax=Nicotiana tomentosiformis TaxID=4098 RepID=UPI00051BAE54|nr:uncharacterized protein LOC104094581 [Nicotiana tomentosiformis]
MEEVQIRISQGPLIRKVTVKTNTTILMMILLCMRTVRRMSRELQDEYNRQVEESEGFDITLDLTLGAGIGAPILPQRGNEGDPIFVDLSRRAIENFNSQNATTYRYVKNVTVNTSYAAGMWCYITFEARDADANATTDDDSSALKTFQALAWWGIDGERDVRYCRFKKPSTH